MKKIIALILCAVCALTVFAACGKKDDSGKDATEKGYSEEDIVVEHGYSYVIKDEKAIIVKYSVHDNVINLQIPETLGGKPVAVIAEGAFAGYNFKPASDEQDVSEVRFPGTLETIEAGAFKGSSIHKALMVYSPKLKSIGANAFEGCENLVQLDIPASVEEFGAGCFANCPKLRVVTFRGNLKPDVSIFSGSTKDFTVWTNTKNKDTIQFAKDNGYEFKTGDNI
ncbi:MAG: leucine-rich repeat domain-containing protein [Clostridia bacterium]|nr:leucine-rich repeat domain-containing protein [Clostridia bacterium]